MTSTFEKDGMLICGYDSVMSQKCAENLVKKYGADNWYDWSLGVNQKDLLKSLPWKHTKNVPNQPLHGSGKKNKALGKNFLSNQVRL